VFHTHERARLDELTRLIERGRGRGKVVLRVTEG
jgi:hypothetical protein